MHRCRIQVRPRIYSPLLTHHHNLSSSICHSARVGGIHCAYWRHTPHCFSHSQGGHHQSGAQWNDSPSVSVRAPKWCAPVLLRNFLRQLTTFLLRDCQRSKGLRLPALQDHGLLLQGRAPVCWTASSTRSDGHSRCAVCISLRFMAWCDVMWCGVV
jgi:hypothetical protein